MSTLITLPHKYKSGSASPSSWPGTSTSAKFSNDSRSHLSGTTKTDNSSQKTLDENTDPGGNGSIYTSSSEGFNCNVYTKTTNDFYSKHFLGHKNGTSISSGSTIGNTTKSTWLKDVVGFHCEISARPASGSSSESDGMGVVQQFRICAVYSDSSKKVRILEMTNGGTKLSSQAYNSSPGTGWKVLSYALSQTDSMKVVNGNWRLYGWIVEMYHKKTGGGGTKYKNCTGRIRYMRPLISSTGSNGLSTSSASENILVYHPDSTLAQALDTSGPKPLNVV